MRANSQTIDRQRPLAAGAVACLLDPDNAAFLFRTPAGLALLGAAILVTAAGHWAAGIRAQWTASFRRARLRRASQELLDFLELHFHLGPGLDQSIDLISKQLAKVYPEMCKELKYVTLEMRIGKRRVDALRNFAARTGVHEIESLVSVLNQADRFGSGIEQSVADYAARMRRGAAQAEEEAAALTGWSVLVPFVCLVIALLIVTEPRACALRLCEVTHWIAGRH